MSACYVSLSFRERDQERRAHFGKELKLLQTGVATACEDFVTLMFALFLFFGTATPSSWSWQLAAVAGQEELPRR